MNIQASKYHGSLHLDNDKLELPDEGCPFCGSTNRCPVHIIQTNPQVSLLKCAQCYAVSASRMPTDKALGEYYRDYYESPVYSDSNECVTFDVSMRFGMHLANKFYRSPRHEHASILDFGGGDGSISHATAVQLLKNGVKTIEITVIDYCKHIVLPEDNRITMSRADSLDDVRSFFDFVIASAVLEHIPQPKDVLKELLQHTERGGMFYARTPNVLPFIKVLELVGIKFDFTFPAHVHDLGQDFWENYFNNDMYLKEFKILISKPSIVETSLKKNFMRTITACFLKAPWYILGKKYPLVGGWEVFVQRH